MAFSTKHLFCLVLFLSFYFLLTNQLLQSPAGCNACNKFEPVLKHGNNRKMGRAKSFGEKKVSTFNNGVSKPTHDNGGSTSTSTSSSDEWELRTAPMGPDPLHHHGGGTEKPWTP